MSTCPFRSCPLASARFRHPALLHLFPFLRWWPMVSRGTVRADLLAGLVGALVVLPQGVAFATLAGMPPEYGLYCAMVPTIIAALWGSSLQGVSGPTNAVSLVVFATLAPLAAPGSAEYISLALTLALMSGVMLLALGVLRFGTVVNFMSHTVVIGFTAGIGILILANQLPNFFGVDVPRGGSFLQTLLRFAAKIPHTHPWTLAIALITLAGGILGRRFLPRVPYMITAMFVGALAGEAAMLTFGAERVGLRLLGPLPGALPPLSLPVFSFSTMQSLLGISLTVTLLSLSQGLTIAKSIAQRSGQRLDVNQELIGQGLSNMVAAFFSGYPSSVSANRAGINFESGARTPLSAVFSALFLVVVLLGVAPLAAYLPLATMAGILMLVGWSLIDFKSMRHVGATSRSEAAVLYGTLAATLLLNLEIAILVGVTASLLLFLHQTSHPAMRSIVPDPRHPQRKVTEVEDDLAECPQLKLLRIEGAIYFGAVNHVEQHLDTLREIAPGQKHLLIMSKSINFVDLAGAELLSREARKRRAAGGALYFYSLRKPVEGMLERGHYMTDIGHERIYRGKAEAIAGVFERLDRTVCSRCTARIFNECKTLPPPVTA